MRIFISLATTVRVSEQTRARAAALAAERGSSIGEVVDAALDAYETAEFWRRTVQRLKPIPMRVYRTRCGSAAPPTESRMSDARRGEPWLLDLGEPVGRGQGFNRPGLVVRFLEI